MRWSECPASTSTMTRWDGPWAAANAAVAGLLVGAAVAAVAAWAWARRLREDAAVAARGSAGWAAVVTAGTVAAYVVVGGRFASGAFPCAGVAVLHLSHALVVAAALVVRVVRAGLLVAFRRSLLLRGVTGRVVQPPGADAVAAALDDDRAVGLDVTTEEGRRFAQAVVVTSSNGADLRVSTVRQSDDDSFPSSSATLDAMLATTANAPIDRVAAAPTSPKRRPGPTLSTDLFTFAFAPSLAFDDVQSRDAPPKRWSTLWAFATGPRTLAGVLLGMWFLPLAAALVGLGAASPLVLTCTVGMCDVSFELLAALFATQATAAFAVALLIRTQALFVRATPPALVGHQHLADTTEDAAEAVLRESVLVLTVLFFGTWLGLGLLAGDPNSADARGLFPFEWFVLAAVAAVWVVLVGRPIASAAHRRVRSWGVPPDSLDVMVRRLEDPLIATKFDRFAGDSPAVWSATRFVLDATRWRALFPERTPEWRIAKAKRIMKRYLLVNAVVPVAVSTAARVAMEHQFALRGPKFERMFDDCVEEVGSFLRTGAWRDFAVSLSFPGGGRDRVVGGGGGVSNGSGGVREDAPEPLQSLKGP